MNLKEMAEKIRNATAKSALDRQVEEAAAADVDNEEGYEPLEEPGKAKE